MNLSPNFTLEELTFTNHRKYDNTPPPRIVEQLTITAKALEEVRSLLGTPVNVNSGYRSHDLNKAIGGAKLSQHVTGQAVDFTARKYGSPDDVVKAIMDSNIQYDQLIREFDSWIHISFDDKPRRQTLIIDKKGTRLYVV